MGPETEGRTKQLVRLWNSQAVITACLEPNSDLDFGGYRRTLGLELVWVANMGEVNP